MTDLVIQRQNEKQLMYKAINLLFTEPIKAAYSVTMNIFRKILFSF